MSRFSIKQLQLTNNSLYRNVASLVHRILLNIKFRLFIAKIHPDTLKKRAGIVAWATEKMNFDEQNQAAPGVPVSPIVAESLILRKQILDTFKNKVKDRTDLRILIHVPDSQFSPAGYSIFKNLVAGLDYIGIPVIELGWNDTISNAFSHFSPNVFLTSDSAEYINRIDWRTVREYKKKHFLKLGLTASIEAYGNTPLNQRLAEAEQKDVDFFFSFRSQEYLQMRQDYKPFYENGYKIFSIEFGANPLIHYVIPSAIQDFDYVFLASVNGQKWQRYFKYLDRIISKHTGVLDGPGWPFSRDFVFCQKRDAYLYSRCKVGLNLHIEEQIEWPCEVNERTYILAACGIPQLVDNAALIKARFSTDSLFIADSPKEYWDLFEFLIANPDIAKSKALNAHKEVMAKHTIFHRAEQFVNQIHSEFFA